MICNSFEFTPMIIEVVYRLGRSNNVIFPYQLGT